MHYKQNLPWSQLQPRFKLYTSAPTLISITISLASLYPIALFLGETLGVSASEPVIANPNGSTFMVLIILFFAVSLFVITAFGYLLLALYLKHSTSCSWAESIRSINKSTYPSTWYVEPNNRS